MFWVFFLLFLGKSVLAEEGLQPEPFRPDLRLQFGAQALVQGFNQIHSAHPIRFIDKNVPVVKVNVKGVQIPKPGETLDVWASKLLQIFFNEKLDLGLKIQNLRLQSELRFDTLEFKQSSPHAVEVHLKGHLPKLFVSTPRVLIRYERGVLHPQKQSPHLLDELCTDQSSWDTFVKNTFWAQALDVHLVPKRVSNIHIPFEARIEFFRDEKNQKIKTRLLNLKSNFKTAVGENYSLELKELRFAPVFFKIKNKKTGLWECNPIDTFWVEQFFYSKLDEIRHEIAKESEKSLTQYLLGQANQALQKVAYSSQYATQYIKSEQTKNGDQSLLGLKVPQWFLGLFSKLTEFKFSLYLDRMEVASTNRLKLNLEEQLELNAQAGVSTRSDVTLLDKPIKSDEIALSLSFESLTEKIDLLRRTTFLSELLPKGVHLDEKGVKLLPVSKKELALWVPIVIRLGELAFPGSLARFLSKELKISIPLKISFRIIRSLGEPYLFVFFDTQNLQHLQFQKEFMLHDNLESSFLLLRSLVQKKLNKIKANLHHQYLLLPLKAFSKKTGFDLTQIEVDSDRYIHIQAKISDFDVLLKRLKGTHE